MKRMRFLRKLLRQIWVLFLTYLLVSFLAVAALFFTAKYWLPKVVAYCEQKSGEAFDAQVQITDLRISHIWPLTLGFENIHAQSHARTWRLDLERLDVSLAVHGVTKDWHRPVVNLNLKFKGPRVDYVPASVAKSPPPQWTHFRIDWPRLVQPTQPSAVVVDVATQVQVEEGSINFQGQQPWALTEVKAQATWPSLRSPMWAPSLSLEAQFARSWGRQSIRLPINFSIKDLKFNSEKFDLNESRMALGPIRAQGRGQMNWVEGQGHFHFAVEPTDLKDLPQNLMPSGNWQGHFKGEADLNLKEGSPAEWKIQVASENVHGDLNETLQGTEVQGEVGIEARLKMTTGTQLLVDELALSADLTKAKLKRGTFFEKRIGQTFFIDVNADGREESLILRRAFLRLGGLRVEGQGQIKTNEPGTTQIKMQIPATLAMGLEDLFPQLRGAPFRGHLQGEMELNGNWRKPETLEFAIHGLKWSNAVVEMAPISIEGLDLKGPLGLDVELEGVLKSGSADFIRVRARADGTGLEIQKGMARKARGQSLHVDLNGRFSPEKWDLTDWKVELLNSRLRATGAILWGATVRPNLIFYLDSNDLRSLHKICVGCAWQVAGRLNGRLGLTGTYVLAEKWLGSPLTLQGEVKWTQSQFSWSRLSPKRNTPSSSEVGADSGEEGQKSESENSLLPNWPLFRNSNVAFKIEGGPWRIAEMELKQVKLNSQFSAAKLSVKGELIDPSSGRLLIKQMLFTPTAMPAGLDAELNWDNLMIAPFLSWVAPSYRQFMSGKLSGQGLILGPVPGLPRWQEQIKVEGKAHLSEAQITTWSWQDLIKNALTKKLMLTSLILGQSRKFSGDLEWSMQNQKIEVPRLVLESDKKDVLNLHGQAELNGAMKMDGDLTLMVNGMKVSPAIRVEGTLKEPKFSVLGP